MSTNPLSQFSADGTDPSLPHYNDSMVPRIMGVSILLIVLSTTVVAARFCARRVRKSPLEADDWLMIPALILTLGLCAVNIIDTHFGDGRHAFAVPVTFGVPFLKMAYILSILYSCVHFFIKMSLLLLYRRIFTMVDKTFRVTLYALMAYIICWSVSALLVCVFACTPVSFFWEQALNILPGQRHYGHCIDFPAAEEAIGVFNAIADLLILMLPWLVLWKLKMTTYRKAGLTLVFSLGCFAVAASIVRCVVVYDETEIDPTWTDRNLLLWTAIEPTVGLLCACFPVIAPAFGNGLFRERFGKTYVGRYVQKVFGIKESTDASIPHHNMQLNHWPSLNIKSLVKGSQHTNKRESYMFADRSWKPMEESTSTLPSPQLKAYTRENNSMANGDSRVRDDLEWNAERSLPRKY